MLEQDYSEAVSRNHPKRGSLSVPASSMSSSLLRRPRGQTRGDGVFQQGVERTPRPDRGGQWPGEGGCTLPTSPAPSAAASSPSGSDIIGGGVVAASIRPSAMSRACIRFNLNGPNPPHRSDFGSEKTEGRPPAVSVQRRLHLKRRRELIHPLHGSLHASRSQLAYISRLTTHASSGRNEVYTAPSSVWYQRVLRSS